MENTGSHIGLVTALNGGDAKIRFQRGSACAHCGACLTIGESEMEITLKNSLGAKIGERVAVDLSPKRVVQASLLAYAVPLVLLVGGGVFRQPYCGLGWAYTRYRRLWNRVSDSAARGKTHQTYA